MAVSIQSAQLITGFKLPYLVLMCCVLFAACNPRETPIFKKLAEASDREITARTEEAIRNDPELQKLNEICDSIPRPADAELIRKSFGGGVSDERWLLFLFSTESTFPALSDLWDKYISQEGWSVVERSYTGRRNSVSGSRAEYGIELHFDEHETPTTMVLYCTKTEIH